MAINNEVNITLTAKDKASKKFAKVDKSATGLGSRLKKLGGPLKKVGIGLAAAGVAAGAVGVKLFNLADSVETTIGKAQTVFGEYFDDMDKFAAETGKAMGLSRSEFLKTAAGMQDLLVPMGFTREAAAGMTQETIGLAGALSEWSAGQFDAAQVGDILTKAMLGERDQLKALGISISEADVQQRLLDNGAKELTGTALAQAKAIATQQLIFEKSTDAQKAYADGADSLTRKKAEMSATLKNLQETIATALLPAFHEIVTVLQPVIEKVAENIKLWFQNKENVEKLTGVIKTIIGVFGLLFTAIGKVIWFLTKMGEMFGTVAAEIVIFSWKVSDAFESMGNKIAEIWNGVKEVTLSVFESIKEIVTGVIDSITSKFTAAFDKIKAIANKIKALGGAIGGAVSSAASSAKEFVSGTKANGGDVSAGQTYRVGERGSELFVPKQDGAIVPNGGSSNSIDKIEINVNGSGDPMEAAILMKQELTETLQMYKFGIT